MLELRWSYSRVTLDLSSDKVKVKVKVKYKVKEDIMTGTETVYDGRKLALELGFS